MSRLSISSSFLVYCHLRYSLDGNLVKSCYILLNLRYKRVPPHVKVEIHKMIVQPAMLYGMETVPVTVSHVKKLEVTEMMMCRWACGHTLRDNVRNYDIRERLKVDNITEMCRKARMRLFGHVNRRDQDYIGRKTLEMVPHGRRKRARPKQRWTDCVIRDVRAIGTTKGEVHDRTDWRRIVSAAATHNQVRAARRRRKRLIY